MGAVDDYQTLVEQENKVKNVAATVVMALGIIVFFTSLMIKHAMLGLSLSTLQIILFVTAFILFLGGIFLRLVNTKPPETDYV